MTEIWCKRCLYPSDHPLHINFDESGICSGCRVHEEKKTLDWEARWQELERLVAPYRSKTGTYDCIIPVTGAGDSFYVVYVARHRLKLRPLLVHFNNHFSTSLGIRNLAALRMIFGCDLRTQALKPSRVRRITSTTLADLGSVYWASHAGRTVWPVQTAVRTQIPLILWGAHQGLEQTGQYSHLDNVEMTRRSRKEHDLLGYEPEDLVTELGLLREEDVEPLFYPSDSDLRRVGVRGIYIGNYVRWDSRTQNEAMTRQFNFRPARVPGTFDIFDHADCAVYMTAHDALKRARLGYGRVTDHAVREIRHGRLSRDTACTLVHHYEETEENRGVGPFAAWLGVSTSGWHHLVRRWTRHAGDPPTSSRHGSWLEQVRAWRFSQSYCRAESGHGEWSGDLRLIERGYP